MDLQNGQEPEIVKLGPDLPMVLTRQNTHRSTVIWNNEDPGALQCCGRLKEMEKRPPMLDQLVVNIIKLVGLEGLFRASTQEIDHALISAFVEQWRPETHTFHLPHGEMTITLQDVEVILGLPIEGQVLVGSTVPPEKSWSSLCEESLGIAIARNYTKTLIRQRILITRLFQRIAHPLPDDAMEIQIHQYDRCYILALLGDTIFSDKSGDRVHLMFLEFLQDLRNPPQYSWGSACPSMVV